METLFTREGTPFKSYSFNDKGQPFVQIEQKCSRCGGAGGADKWKFTGWTCYRCGGKCVDPTPLNKRLYTAEQNAKLNAAQAKRDATKAAKRAEAARVEQLRRDAERSEIISAHQSILARIKPHLPEVVDEDERDGAVRFLSEMVRQIEVEARALTEKQLAAVERICTRREQEAARIARAEFIGEIGERREFTLTLGRVFYDEISRFPTIGVYTVYGRTEEGCTVIYKGSDAYIIHQTLPTGYDNDRVWAVDRKVRIKATVKEHFRNKKGEPCTKINRPKLLEVIDEGQLPVEYRK